MKILGITTSHEAGATLIEDGRIIASVNEERLNRRKCSAGIPTLSLKWIITLCPPSEIDAIALAGLVHRAIPPIATDCTRDGVASQDMRFAEWIAQNGFGDRIFGSSLNVKAYRKLARLLPQTRLKELHGCLERLGLKAPLTLCDHHTAHLASAYYTSGWADALVVSNDGFGDGYCSKIATGRDGEMTEIDANPFYNSIGMYYLYVTHLCGFPMYYHAGKTMGLAASGDMTRTKKYFEASISFDPQTGRYLNHGLIFRKEIERMRQSFNGTSREHVAAGIQDHVENILAQQVSYYINRTGLRKVVLTGGVHANVRANQKIAEIPEVEAVFVHPNMGDGGLATGAALWLWSKLAEEKGISSIPQCLSDVYLGPSYSDHDAESVLNQSGLNFSRPFHLAHEVAKLLSQGKIVARCEGKMEYGPRALGNRSILYPATDKSVNTWLNTQLQRTEFMPFAPVIRDVDAPLFLSSVGPKTMEADRFMTITHDVTERCKREAPAIVHVDGTARPQIVSRKENPGYYEILGEYKNLTGYSVLVNTSFNMHEEPIVCSPQDAIRAFQRGNLDSLILNSFLITK